ncbi:hypothetical protein BDR07DRAFT_1321117, partial [Suillus spraguei]
RCVQRKCFVRGKRYSILPILTLDGIIAYDIIEGPVTSERFVRFLREHVVSLMNASPHNLLGCQHPWLRRGYKKTAEIRPSPMDDTNITCPRELPTRYLNPYFFLSVTLYCDLSCFARMIVRNSR